VALCGGCQKNVADSAVFFLQPLMPQFRCWVFLSRILFTRLHPHRLRHCRAFVFSRLWRKNPSHPLCGWPVTRNIIMESAETLGRFKLEITTDIKACLLNYRHLVVRVDQLLVRIQRKYGRHIECHKGCGCGCRNISIFPVEALSLADALQELPEALIAKFQKRAASASFWDCPLLEDRACSMYAFRPLTCRTHGFPLQTIYKGQSSIGYCRYNFKEMTSIPEDAIIDLDSINDTLRGINATAVDELAHILKLPDRLSIAEAVRLGNWEAWRL